MRKGSLAQRAKGMKKWIQPTKRTGLAPKYWWPKVR